MKPLSCNYIRPLATPELERLAGARFKKLRALSADEAQRRELRAADVVEARIRNLYPFDFSEISDPVREMISRESLASTNNLFDETISSVKQLVSIFPAHAVRRLEAARESAAGKVATRKLNDHVGDLLPQTNSRQRALNAGIIVGGLWYACAGMEALEELAPPSGPFLISPNRRIVVEAFVRIVDLMLPHMRLEELVEEEYNHHYFKHFDEQVVW